MHCHDILVRMLLWESEGQGYIFILSPALCVLVQTTEPVDKVEYRIDFKDSESLTAERYNT